METTEQVLSRLPNPNIIEAGLPTRWKPGRSGNPNGRQKNAVTTLLKEKDTQKVADKLYEMVLAGEMPAIKEYLERTEGKVADKHLNVNITVTPESLLEAQQRLLNAQRDTNDLLKDYPKKTKEL